MIFTIDNLNINRYKLMKSINRPPYTTKKISNNNKNFYVKTTQESIGLIESYLTRLIYLLGSTLEVPVAFHDFVITELDNELDLEAWIISSDVTNGKKSIKLPPYNNIYEGFEVIKKLVDKYNQKDDLIDTFFKQQLFALFVADRDRVNRNTKILVDNNLIEMGEMFDFDYSFYISTGTAFELKQNYFYYGDKEKQFWIDEYNKTISSNEEKMSEKVIQRNFINIFNIDFNEIINQDYGNRYTVDKVFHVSEFDVFCFCLDNIKDKEFINKLLDVDILQLLLDDYHEYNKRSIFLLTSLIEARKEKFREFYEIYKQNKKRI